MTNGDSTTCTQRAADWRVWRAWVDECAGNLFPSHASFEWFVRHHRDALVASGQFIPRRGRGGAIVGPEIDRVVLDIMRRDALAADAAA